MDPFCVLFKCVLVCCAEWWFGGPDGRHEGSGLRRSLALESTGALTSVGHIPQVFSHTRGDSLPEKVELPVLIPTPMKTVNLWIGNSCGCSSVYIIYQYNQYNQYNIGFHSHKSCSKVSAFL